MNLKTRFNGLKEINGFRIINFQPGEAFQRRMAKFPEEARARIIVIRNVAGPVAPIEFLQLKFKAVMSVSAEIDMPDFSRDDLVQSIREGLAQQEIWEKAPKNRRRPTADPAGAQELDNLIKAQKPYTPEQQKAFLDEFYGGSPEGP